MLLFIFFIVFNGNRTNADERVRTFVGTKPTDFESVPFDHSGTSANL